MNIPPNVGQHWDAADIIDSLLQIDPRKRLGAGQPGSNLDYQALKNHAFFNGIDFENLKTAKVSVEQSSWNGFVAELNRNMPNDGSDDEDGNDGPDMMAQFNAGGQTSSFIASEID